MGSQQQEKKHQALQDEKKQPKALQDEGVQSDKVCPYRKKCGGCVYQGMPYDEQLSLKQKEVEKQIGKFGKVQKIVGMNYPYYYRNKVHAFFDFEKGKTLCGTYQEGTHRVVPIESCLIDDQHADKIVLTIRDLIRSFKIKVYDEGAGYGVFRRVLIRRAQATGEVMVVLVTASPVFPSKNNFVKALKEKHPEITTVVQNINEKHTSMVLGPRNVTLYGKGYIIDNLCGMAFAISPSTFYQVNPLQTKKLYNKAMEYAALTGWETVIDAYCGIGTIGMIAAEKAGKVIGVELNGESVKNARNNAKHNNIKNIQFYQNDASVFMDQMALRAEKADVIFMDPPRSGSTDVFIMSCVALRPERIVYISCSPETLGRDLELFQKFGYRMQEATPVDMFPWTGHIEVVCLLGK